MKDLPKINEAASWDIQKVIILLKYNKTTQNIVVESKKIMKLSIKQQSSSINIQVTVIEKT